MSSASTARRVSFRDTPSSQYPTGKELAASYHQFGDPDGVFPPDGATKTSYKPHPGSARPGRYRPPPATLPPKAEMLHRDGGDNFSWKSRTTSAKATHSAFDRGGGMIQAAGSFRGVKGPRTNFAMHADEQLTPQGWRTLNDGELPWRRVEDAYTPSAPSLMRDFMRHGDRLNEPRPSSSYRREIASDLHTGTVHDAAEHFQGNLSFRRHRPKDREPIPGSAIAGESRYRPTTATLHRGEYGDPGQPSSNPLYTYRGHTSVPQGDRVKSATPTVSKVQEDFPEHSLRNHRPYSRTRAFPSVLGTNAQLGDDRLLPTEEGTTTARDYPEKMPVDPITRALPGKKNISVLPANDEDRPRDQDRRRLTSAKLDFRQPPANSHPEHFPFVNAKNLSSISMPLSPRDDTFRTTTQSDFGNNYRPAWRADPPPSYNIPMDYGFGPGSSVSRVDYNDPHQHQAQPVDPRVWDQLHRSHWHDQEEASRQLCHETHTVLSHRPMTGRRERPDTGRVHRSNLPMEPQQFRFEATALT